MPATDVDIAAITLDLDDTLWPIAPVIARAVLRIGLLYLITTAFFWLLKHTAGERAALVGAILFSATPALTAALGTDYIDGPAIAYQLIAMACALQAARGSRPR